MRHTLFAKVLSLVLLGLVVLSADIAVAQPRGKQAPKSRIPRGSGTVSTGPVQKVNANSLDSVRKSSQQIDRMVEQLYRTHSVEPTANLSDSLFCRRAYLEIGGRIPTLREVGDFVQSKDPNRREQLIDQLLSSHDYVSHMFNYWADVLRLKDNPINGNQIAQPYHEWIKQSIARNVPYDKWVYEMLTATGRIWENPAVGYIMRESGMELDAVDSTVQVFLGTQIGCAQCHDHPFDKWTQREFYQMAAFTFGTRTRVFGGDKSRFKKGNPVTRLRNELKAMDPDANTGGTFNRMIQANFFEVYDQPKRPLKLPHDYQYDNGKPNQTIAAKPIFGEARITAGKTPRVAMAEWLTSPDNPRFAKNIANRLWKKSFGVGLIEPVNDIRDDSVCSNPRLLNFLTSELVRLKFDTRELQRIIFNTRVWQREAFGSDVDISEPYYFPGPLLRRMTAEQIWDSLLTLAVYNPQSFTRPSMKNVSAVINLDLDNVTAAQVKQRAEEFDKQFSSRAERARVRANNSYKGMTLARASELPMPLPPSHFLRQFGQGDRELIEASSRDGSVSQVLTMFNGEITHMMLDGGSLIYDTVMSAPNLSSRINAIFYSILTRRPRTNEMETAESEIRASGNAGFGNVIWALVNTKEFLFIQ